MLTIKFLVCWLYFSIVASYWNEQLYLFVCLFVCLFFLGNSYPDHTIRDNYLKTWENVQPGPRVVTSWYDFWSDTKWQNETPLKLQTGRNLNPSMEQYNILDASGSEEYFDIFCSCRIFLSRTISPQYSFKIKVFSHLCNAN